MGKRNRLLLDTQPENEDAIEYTHFDCWPNTDDQDAPENAAFVVELLDKWAIDYALPNLRDYAKRYLELGQVSLFQLVALEFIQKGYRVYDGDECFEVYAKPIEKAHGGLYLFATPYDIEPELEGPFGTEAARLARARELYLRNVVTSYALDIDENGIPTTWAFAGCDVGDEEDATT